jgi:DNA-binding CsgD family transcriptional regulator
MAGLAFYFMFGTAQKPFDVIIGISVAVIFVLSVIATERASRRLESFVEKTQVDSSNISPDANSSIVPSDSFVDGWADILDDRVRRFSLSFRLSNREEEIIGLLVRGRSTPKIAESMFVTSGTIKTHLTHIYQKIDVSGRQELIDRFDDFS